MKRICTVNMFTALPGKFKNKKKCSPVGLKTINLLPSSSSVTIFTSSSANICCLLY